MASDPAEMFDPTRYMYLDAHKIDDLIGAVNALRYVLMDSARESRSLTERAILANQQALLVLEKIAEHTKNLPALVEAMRERSNGKHLDNLVELPDE